MSTVTRIVCGDKGELHYSATPDLAMDICPVCDTHTVAKGIDISEPKNKTLFDLLFDADAIEIDDEFIRDFELDPEPEDGIGLYVDFNGTEYAFTKDELESATKDESFAGGYKVITGSEQNGIYKIIPYIVIEMKA